MPLDAPLAEMLRNVAPLAPIVVLTMFTPGPVVVEAVLLFAPVVTATVPPPVAVKPVPLVVVIAKPPLEKLIVAPALLVRETAVLAPVLKVLLAPLNVIVPLVQFCTLNPVPLSPMLPDRVTL